MASNTLCGERSLGRGLGSVPREASSSQKATHPWHSRCQTGPRSQRTAASSGRHSQRCSALGARAEQGPGGKASDSLNTAPTAEREDPPPRGQGDPSPPQAVHAGPTETGWDQGRSMGLSKSPLPWSSKGGFTSKHADFSHSAWTAGHIRSPTLKGRGEGFWGCLQMMAVIPAMSSSSSTAPAVNPGSPENTWLGHRARSRLRMVSRRTARVKGRTAGSTPEAKWAKTSGHPSPILPTPGRAITFARPLAASIPTPCPSCQSQKVTKEKSPCSPSRKAHP